MLTINLLQALPKTPLWDRLAKENRLIDDDSRDSNVDFLLPYDQVVNSWRKSWKSPSSRRSSLRATSTRWTLPMPTG